MPPRDFYIDRLRSAITVLVILHHTAITYGAIGGWFWREAEPSRTLSGILLILFCTTNQAYFMGFFFLLAGYFTPASLDRKGYRRFILDRFIRLGIPILAFTLILGPLTVALVTLLRETASGPPSNRFGIVGRSSSVRYGLRKLCSCSASAMHSCAASPVRNLAALKRRSSRPCLPGWHGLQAP
jgi:Acyltransferase family